MFSNSNIQLKTITPVNKLLFPIALGGCYFGADPWNEKRSKLIAALETAIANGLNHFDTATDYGDGQSERS